MVTNKLVLLIEDDPSDARLIQRAFDKAKLNIELTRLTNGDDAVAYLGGKPPYDNRALYPIPAVLLLDIKLPRRSGLEVLSWLRNQHYGLKRLPVIILTSSRHSIDVNRAYDLGVNSYLAKPESTSDLTRLAESFHSYWLQLNENPDVQN
ncbi:MAG TPA: response regulator [Terriglobales bacterium]|nr:response regulator [Terriglobales bacterium]